MQDPIGGLPAEMAEALNLGQLVGKNQAFGLMAARCSAAQAESLWRLRTEQKYKRVLPNWREFCCQYLKMSQTHADQVIGLWEEFGAGYFEVAQLTRISAETYRALAPSIQDGALHAEGEAIAINEENAQKISDAVARLRRALPRKRKDPAAPLMPRERLPALEKRCMAAIAEFEELAGTERDSEEHELFQGTLARIIRALGRVAMQIGGL